MVNHLSSIRLHPQFSYRVGENRPKVRREKEPLHLVADIIDILEAVVLTIVLILIAGGPIFVTLLSNRGKYPGVS